MHPPSLLARQPYNIGPYSQSEDRNRIFHEQEEMHSPSLLARQPYIIGPYSQSKDRSGRFHEEEKWPSSYNAQTSSMSKQIHNASSRSSMSPNSRKIKYIKKIIIIFK